MQRPYLIYRRDADGQYPKDEYPGSDEEPDEEVQRELEAAYKRAMVEHEKRRLICFSFAKSLVSADVSIHMRCGL